MLYLQHVTRDKYYFLTIGDKNSKWYKDELNIENQDNFYIAEGKFIVSFIIYMYWRKHVALYSI